MTNNNASAKSITAALIGGSGFSQMLDDSTGEPPVTLKVETVYGDVYVLVYSISDCGKFVFLPRHGFGHTIAPHLINHRANISALAQLGVADILATSAVGSLRRDLDAGTLVVLDDFVDLRGGATTFYNTIGNVRHTDFSEPLSEDLRRIVLEEAGNLSATWPNAPLVYPAGTYLCLNGPRYETPAEVRIFGSWGLDVVGMTLAPEAILARECDIRYANVALVSNLGTGLSTAALSHAEVESQMAQAQPFLQRILLASIRRLL